MKRVYFIIGLLVCAVLVSGCVSVDEGTPAEYHKHVIELPGEFGIIWTDEQNKDIIHLSVFSEEYFQIIDDSSIERAVSENERAMKKYIENLGNEYSIICIYIEEIGDDMLAVSYMESGDREPSSYTIEKETYLEINKDNPLFEYPDGFMPVEEVSAW